nr:FeoA family protein [Candidatus Formimonas warabiya]
MPLTMLPVGQEGVVKGCRAKEVTRKYLEGLGLVPGTPVTVILENTGNLIVAVKNSRLALSKGIAQQLLVEVAL